MRLHIEGKDVAAQVTKHVFVHQDVPERANVFVADLALIRAGKAVDGKHRVMAKDELMSRVAMFSQRCLQPLDFDMALSSEAAPERIDEHHEKVTAPYELGETSLPRRSVI